MEKKVWLIYGIGILLLFSVAGCGGGTASNIIETKSTFPAVIDGQTYDLEYRLDRPADGLAHPLIIFTHGRNGPHPSRNPQEITGYPEIVNALAGQGYTVLFLVRRGYGNSDGSTDTELKDSAHNSGLEGAKDINSAVEFIKTSPYVDPNKVMIMGHSQGGWMAIASSTLNISGLLGTVDISGGTNYADMGSGSITQSVQDHWIAACGDYGKIAKVPMLWLHAMNDNSIPYQTAQAMFNNYQANGGTGIMVMKAAHGSDGHLMVGDPPYIMGDIISFFNSVGFTN